MNKGLMLYELLQAKHVYKYAYEKVYKDLESCKRFLNSNSLDSGMCYYFDNILPHKSRVTLLSELEKEREPYESAGVNWYATVWSLEDSLLPDDIIIISIIHTCLAPRLRNIERTINRLVKELQEE